MKRLVGLALCDLLPDSISKDTQVDAAARAIDPHLRLMALALDLPALYASIDSLTSQQLDHMATQWDVLVWRDSWPLAKKRVALKASIINKRQKGTLNGIRRAVSFLATAENLDKAMTFEEWWETGPDKLGSILGFEGIPHTFLVFLDQGQLSYAIDREVQTEFVEALNNSKPLRSHYMFVIKRYLETTLNFYMQARVAVTAKLETWRPRERFIVTTLNFTGVMQRPAVSAKLETWRPRDRHLRKPVGICGIGHQAVLARISTSRPNAGRLVFGVGMLGRALSIGGIYDVSGMVYGSSGTVYGMLDCGHAQPIVESIGFDGGGAPVLNDSLFDLGRADSFAE